MKSGRGPRRGRSWIVAVAGIGIAGCANGGAAELGLATGALCVEGWEKDCVAAWVETSANKIPWAQEGPFVPTPPPAREVRWSAGSELGDLRVRFDAPTQLARARVSGETGTLDLSGWPAPAGVPSDGRGVYSIEPRREIVTRLDSRARLFLFDTNELAPSGAARTFGSTARPCWDGVDTLPWRAAVDVSSGVGVPWDEIDDFGECWGVWNDRVWASCDGPAFLGCGPGDPFSVARHSCEASSMRRWCMCEYAGPPSSCMYTSGSSPWRDDPTSPWEPLRPGLDARHLTFDGTVTQWARVPSGWSTWDESVVSLGTFPAVRTMRLYDVGECSVSYRYDALATAVGARQSAFVDRAARAGQLPENAGNDGSAVRLASAWFRAGPQLGAGFDDLVVLRGTYRHMARYSRVGEIFAALRPSVGEFGLVRFDEVYLRGDSANPIPGGTEMLNTFGWQMAQRLRQPDGMAASMTTLIREATTLPFRFPWPTSATATASCEGAAPRAPVYASCRHRTDCAESLDRAMRESPDHPFFRMMADYGFDAASFVAVTQPTCDPASSLPGFATGELAEGSSVCAWHFQPRRLNVRPDELEIVVADPEDGRLIDAYWLLSHYLESGHAPAPSSRLTCDRWEPAPLDALAETGTLSAEPAGSGAPPAARCADPRACTDSSSPREACRLIP